MQELDVDFAAGDRATTNKASATFHRRHAIRGTDFPTLRTLKKQMPTFVEFVAVPHKRLTGESYKRLYVLVKSNNTAVPDHLLCYLQHNDREIGKLPVEGELLELHALHKAITNEQTMEVEFRADAATQQFHAHTVTYSMPKRDVAKIILSK